MVLPRVFYFVALSLIEREVAGKGGVRLKRRTLPSRKYRNFHSWGWSGWNEI